MAWAFIIGSAAFVVGVPLSENTALSPAVGAAVFFLGSVFFTTAGTLQFLASREELPPEPGGRSGWFRSLARPRTVDWTASAVQLAGTLWFNVTTGRALVDALGTGEATTSQVWRPDALGSIAFLVASWLAFAPEVRWRRHAGARDRSWAIAALNMLGSVLFGISAVGAFTRSSGELVNLGWANAGTALGAVCFLVGAVLLLPRHADPAPSPG
jgi:hypothetical protein